MVKYVTFIYGDSTEIRRQMRGRKVRMEAGMAARLSRAGYGRIVAETKTEPVVRKVVEDKPKTKKQSKTK